MSSHHQFGKKRELGVDAFSVASITESLDNSLLNSSSPYQRIFTKSNLYTAVIPKFLQQRTPNRGITSEDLRKLDLQATTSYSIPESQISENGLKDKVRSILSTLRRLYYFKDINEREAEQIEMQCRQILTGKGSDFTINIKKWSISSLELSKLANNRDISRQIVNSFMQHLKQVNKIRQKSSSASPKFNFSSVEFAESILVKGSLPKASLTVSLYDFHVFPFFHHYWKLLIFCPSQNIAKVFDLGHNHNDCELYTENLENFLTINEQHVSGLKYQLQPQKGIRLWNSGLYICKIISKLIEMEEPVASATELSDFRLEMMIILLELSRVFISSIC